MLAHGRLVHSYSAVLGCLVDTLLMKTTPGSNDAPPLEQAYRRFQPLFLHALSSISREGFNVAPNDALDVIHSFLIDNWSDVREHYDPKKGSIETYAYRSFQHYARRFVARHYREKLQAVDIATLESLTEPDYSSATSDEIDLNQLNESILLLPDDERRVLCTYMETHSERQTACDLDLTRYHVHQRLVHAIARLAIDLTPSHRESPSSGWEITRSVLAHGRTLRQAAQKAGLPVSKARQRHEELLRSLLARVRSMMTQKTATPTMPTQSKKNSLLTVIQAIKADDIEAVRQALKDTDDLSTLLEDLGDSASNVDEELARIELDGENRALMFFYEKVAEQHGPEDYASQLEAFASIGDSEEEQIGSAFGVLMSEVLTSASIPDLNWVLENQPTASRSYVDALESMPAYISDDEHFQVLARHGLSPLDIYYATDSVDSVVRAMIKAEMVESGILVGLETSSELRDGNQLREYNGHFDIKYLITEIQDRTGIEERDVSKRLLHWMIHSSQYTEHLFSGYKAQLVSTGSNLVRIQLTESDMTFNSVGERWTIGQLVG